MKKLILSLLLFEISAIVAIPCPFGNDAFVGQGYAQPNVSTKIGDYIHDAVDIHMNPYQPVIALESGPATIYLGGSEDGGELDCSIRVGDWEYAHICDTLINPIIPDMIEHGIEISVGDTLGYLTTTQTGADEGWSPHIHLVRLKDRFSQHGARYTAGRNPYPALDELLSSIDICDCVKESVNSTSTEIHFTEQSEKGSEIIGNPPVLYGDIDVQANFDIRVNIDSGTRKTSPYQMKWGIDNLQLGLATVDGELPRSPSEQTDKMGNLFSNKDWMISNLAGSYEATDRDLDDVQGLNDYWNTIQGVTGEWNDTTNDPCDFDTRKFPDGPHKVWVWAKTYCGTPIADTVDVIIDNNPPQVVSQTPEEGEPIGSDRIVTFVFSEAIDPGTIEGNISVKALCAPPGSVDVPIDTSNFELSEDGTELSITIPDSFNINDAFYFTLKSDIADLAGTLLDGSGDCVGGDDYKTWVGTVSCTPVFIGQTGGSTDWTIIDNYENYEAKFPCLYKDYEWNGFFAGAYNRTVCTYKRADISLRNFEGVAVTPPWGRFIYVIARDTWGGALDTLWLRGVEESSKGHRIIDSLGRRIEWNFSTDITNIGCVEAKIIRPDGRYITARCRLGYLYKKYLDLYRTYTGCGGAVTMEKCDNTSVTLEEYRYSDQMLTNVQARSDYYTSAPPIEILSINGHTEPGVDIPGYIDELGCEKVGGEIESGRYSGYLGGLQIQEFSCAPPLNCIGFVSSDCNPGEPMGTCEPGNDRYIHPTAPSLELPAGTAEFGIDWGDNEDIALVLGAPLTFTVSDGSGGFGKLVASDEEEKSGNKLPCEYSLGTPRPNPFNTSVSFDIELPEPSIVDLYIFDILGRLVDIPICRTEIPAGRFTENWSCENCPSGVYFVRLSAGDFQSVRKMTLLK